MAITAVPRGTRASERAARTGGANRTFRVLLGLSFLAVCVFLIRFQDQIRVLEARAMASILKPFLGDKVFAWGDRFMIRTDPSHYLGLQITAECTTLVLLIPLLVFSVAVLTFTRVTWPRWIVALVMGMSLMIVVNALRIAMITAATVWWKNSGYEWAHTFVGTVIALIGIVGTALLMLRVMNSKRAMRNRVPVAEPGPRRIGNPEG